MDSWNFDFFFSSILVIRISFIIRPCLFRKLFNSVNFSFIDFSSLISSPASISNKKSICVKLFAYSNASFLLSGNDLNCVSFKYNFWLLDKHVFLIISKHIIILLCYIFFSFHIYDTCKNRKVITFLLKYLTYSPPIKPVPPASIIEGCIILIFNFKFTYNPFLGASCSSK